MLTRFTVAFTIALPLFLLPVGAFCADPQPANPAVVEINGKTLHLSDVEERYPDALFQARTTYYETERRVIDQLIDQYLLEEQARKENVTVDQLLEKHVNTAIVKEPSEEALRVYYEGVDSTESFEALRSKIVDAIHDRRIAKAKTAYIAGLRTSAKILLRLPPPRAPLSMTDTPSRGPATAQVTLLEYADYECPYCQQIQPALNKIEQEFKGTVAFAYKDFPLNIHSNAEKAAEGSQCARLQGKYWEYHDLLASTKQLDPAALKAHARTLHLDTAAFDKCIDGGETADTVKAFQKEAEKLGVQGTPTFFVNGRAITGNVNYDKLRAVIEEELSAAGAQAQRPSREEAPPKRMPIP